MAQIVTARMRIYLGISTFTLYVSEDGFDEKEFLLFTIFINDLIDTGAPSNTVINYGLWVKMFITYMLIGIRIAGDDQANVNLLYRNYHSFLVFGKDSHWDVVRKICDVFPSPMVTLASAQAYHAPLSRLIEESKNHLQKMADYKASGLIVGGEGQESFVHKISSIKITRRSKKDQQAREGYSYGAVSKSTTRYRVGYTQHLPRLDKDEGIIDDDKFFPLEKISQMIESARSWRDASLWAMMAATSLRVSESLQVLWEDIDFAQRKIYAVDPASRKSVKTSYAGLNEAEFKKLSWKGRTTKHTVLLEPYGSMFFEALENYRQFEYNPSVTHNFIFQNKFGAPLFLSDYSSVVYYPFRNASVPILQSVGWVEGWLSPHSLRHSYIYFMKNYLESNRGLGLSDSELMLLTGHADIAALKKYAKCDFEMLLLKIAGANAARVSGNVKSQTEYRIEYLEQKLLDFKALLKKERGNKGVKYD